jgi:hypothetical protein
MLAGLLVVATVAGFVASACGGSDSDAVSAMQKFLQVGQNPGTTNEVLLGKLPDGLPEGLPEYPGSKLIGSTITTSGTAKGLGVLRESKDSVDQIYAFYEQAFSAAPWQVQLSTYPGKVAGVQFSSPDYPDMTGALMIQPSTDDNGGSVIFLSVQTVSGTASAEPFQLEASKPLPLNWPEQVPVFASATITDTGWGSSTSSYEWQITFLAQASPQEIVSYYKTSLTGLGFTVTDEAPQGGATAISFQVAQPTETWSGAVSVQTFAQDPTYTQATVQISIQAAVAQQPSQSPSLTPPP